MRSRPDRRIRHVISPDSEGGGGDRFRGEGMAGDPSAVGRPHALVAPPALRTAEKGGSLVSGGLGVEELGYAGRA
jgi:hypothetical protein